LIRTTPMDDSTMLGVAFAVQAYRLWAGIRSDRRDPDLADDDYSQASLKRAMQLFHGSISYLAVIFLLVGLDPFVV
jgi:heme O synthase-like polyprenyltransferase